MNDKKEPASRKDRILINVYGSSMGISVTALSVAVILEILMLVYTFVNPELYGPYLPRYRGFYLSLLIVAAVAIAVSFFIKKDVPRRFRILVFASPVYAVFLFAWALTVTYSDYSVTGVVDPTVFMTFSLIVPLSVFLYPYVYAIVVTAANMIIFILSLSASGGTGQLINVVIFFIFQIVLGINFLRLKLKLAERIVTEQDNAGIDIMTGFLNRRSYEDDLKNYSEAPVPDGFAYIAIDINGLKAVNDRSGHEAGDKLIVGAARCIEKSFGGTGKLYRIGGDEFAAILSAEKEGADALFDAFEENMKDWSEENGMELTASLGCVFASEFPGGDVTAIARAADAKMYENKANYYKTKSRDRRRAGQD